MRRLGLTLALMVAVLPWLSSATQLDASDVAFTVLHDPVDSRDVGFRISILKDASSWVEATLDGSQRYVQYGRWTLDRNQPLQIFKGYQFLGGFESRGEIYLVGSKQPLSEPSLYRVKFHTSTDSMPPSDLFQKNLLSYGLSALIYAGAGGLSYSWASEALKRGDLGWVALGSSLTLLSAAGAAMIARLAWSPSEGLEALREGAHLQVLSEYVAAPLDSDQGVSSIVPKVLMKQDSLGWTAGNIDVVLADKKVVPLTQVLEGRLLCGELLEFRAP